MPFAVMFGSMGAFLALSRKLELVVTRAAGVSVWQFAFPALFVAALGGVLATTLYDPLSAHLKQRADAMEAKLVGRATKSAAKSILWLRQRSVDGQAVIRVNFAADGGDTLKGVTVFEFDEEGVFEQRVDAEEASLRDGYWLLRDARLIIPGVEPEIAFELHRRHEPHARSAQPDLLASGKCAILATTDDCRRSPSSRGLMRLATGCDTRS